MKKFILIIGLSTLLFSCDFDDGSIFISSGIGSTKKFWAQDYKTKGFYQLNATLLAHTGLCKVWVEQGSGVTEGTARSVAEAYHNTIYPKMMDTFGAIFNLGGSNYLNTMQLADQYLGDGDGKLCILLLDIKDDYQKGENESFVSGYFWSGNLFENDSSDKLLKYSNECDMIYVDTNPGEPGSKESNATLAHEMQHLMNFVTSCAIRTDGVTYVNTMDTWVDEGLSSAAEWLYLEEHPEVRWGWYNQGNNERYGLIDEGNNFFVWDNHDEDPYALLDDYATVYLFFQWLRLQANTTVIYRDIIISDNFDYKAVTEAAKKNINSSYGSNWDLLLGDWLAANYINAASGTYGYKNDPTLKQIKAPYAPAVKTSIELAPGEGVYSKTAGVPTLSGQGSNIKNTYLTSTVNTGYQSNSALLTFNKNTNKEGLAETGVTTGIAASIMPAPSGGRSVIAPYKVKGPFPIGAGDLLRRNGSEEQVLKGLPKFDRVIDD